MNKRYYLPAVLCLLLIPLTLTTGCLPMSGGTAPSAVTGLTDRVTKVEAQAKTLTDENSKQQNSINELYDKKLSKSEYTGSGSTDTYKKTELYTRAEVEAKIAELQAKIDAQKTRIDTWTNPASSPGTTPANPSLPTGQVYYTIVNQQQWYSFATGGVPINIKITNNKSDTRYVRPTISLNTFQGQAAGTWNAAGSSINVMSSSSGQPAVIFTPTASPVGAVTNVVYIPTSGGVISTGEYMVAPGTILDLWVNIVISTTTQVMWTSSVSGSDRPMY